jgi:glycosyltransferase involved in cell wall biosynthesis
MRILELVTSPSWGGAQAQVLLVVKELLARGHDVHVAAGGQGELLERAGAAGAQIHPLAHLTAPVAPHRDLPALSEIVSLLNNIAADVLHTHSAKAGVVGRTAAAVLRVFRSKPMAVVHTCHGLSWGPGRRQGLAAGVFRAAERLTVRWCDHVICVSEELLATVAAQRLYPRAGLRVIHNGIDIGDPGPGPFSPEARVSRASLGLPSGAPLLLLVGRLVTGKGHGLALEAARQLAQEGRAVCIAFAGDGPLRIELEAAARKARAYGAIVEFLGFRSDVPALLRTADILVAPSSAEGFSLAALEGMAAGLPVVASRIPGLREVLVDGETGLLFDLAGGPDAMVEPLRRLLDDPSLARKLGTAGRARAEQHFSLQRTSLTVDFLDDIARCSKAGQLRAAEATDG